MRRAGDVAVGVVLVVLAAALGAIASATLAAVGLAATWLLGTALGAWVAARTFSSVPLMLPPVVAASALALRHLLAADTRTRFAG